MHIDMLSVFKSSNTHGYNDPSRRDITQIKKKEFYLLTLLRWFNTIAMLHIYIMN